MKRRGKAVCLAAITIALGPLEGTAVALGGAERSSEGARVTRTKHYVGTVGYVTGLTTICDAHFGANSNLGQICFPRTPGDFVTIEVHDASGHAVTGWAVFIGPDGRWSGDPTRICGRSMTIPVRPDWRRLDVYLAGPAEALGCPFGSGGAATRGVVRATFASSTEELEPSDPPRWGTLLGGLAAWPPRRCEDVPDCSAWVRSGCSPLLAQRDPAWLASIVDVDDLADGATARSLEVVPESPAGNVAGGVEVQFWTAGCSEITAHRVATEDRATFRVPSPARWMTVVASDNRVVTWILT